uniref:PID domain-containing protein n=1 Tax=Ditylenchus dipsaci TaxID=166011 RepID=A0A915DA35_9BILA
MTAPLCRCRVLYIGSSVPTVTKDGLQGIQQPLKERYPANESTETKESTLGCPFGPMACCWSIWMEPKRQKHFLPIPTCTTVVARDSSSGHSICSNPRQSPSSYFRSNFRRTTGVKVLECHAFICTNEKAANALVRCCFHSYADTIYLKMDDKVPGLKAIKESSRSASNTPSSELKPEHRESRSEFFENEGALMPYGGDPNPGYYNRRSGSHSELRGSGTGEYYEPAGSNYSLYDRGPPNAMHYGPPGHGPPFPQRGGFGGMPQLTILVVSYLRHLHPPAFWRQRPHSGGPPHAPYFGMPFGAGGPPMPPQMGPMPYPPHMMPPRCVFFMPPFGPFPPPPHILCTKANAFRWKGTTYEEPIYMPSNSGTMPPHSSYKPGSMSPEHYEAITRLIASKDILRERTLVAAIQRQVLRDPISSGRPTKQASGNVNGSMNGDADGTLRANKKGDNKSGTHKSDFAVIRPTPLQQTMIKSTTTTTTLLPPRLKNNNSNSNTTQRATVY